jgi:hypothetical protein
MNLKDVPGWRDTVARHWRDTTAYLLALSEPCIGIRDDELEAIKKNRVLVGLEPAALRTWRPSGSWFMAVLLCPGDDLQPVIDWVQAHDVDAGRIHFYIHKAKDVHNFMAAWHEAGLPTEDVDAGIPDWKHLHHLFGLHLSDRILADALQ